MLNSRTSHGSHVTDDTHIIFVFILIAGAIVLRDSGVQSSIILCLGCCAAALFEFRELKVIVRKLLFTSISVFFREIQSVGTENLPRDGPVILVCAPHSNQFVDPAVVMYLLPTDFYTRSRTLGFLIAAKSWRQRVVGMFARLMDGVPVERGQDIARPGTGTLTVSGKDCHHVHGDGTRFTAETKAGDALVCKVEVADTPDASTRSWRTFSFAVVHVLSDTEVRVKPGPDSDLPPSLNVNGVNFKCQPRVTQSRVFKHCHNALGRGDCIGIFPEGGSHDRSHLIPIKAGVSVIALGAMAKHPHSRVRIVCVGLNYFQGHRFRSRAFVEFGDPMDVPPQLVADYLVGLPRMSTGYLVLGTGPTVKLTANTNAELSVGDTISIRLGEGSAAVEKRSVVEKLRNNCEALLSTPLVDASELAQLGSDKVPYTVTTAAGKASQHKACDALLADIKKGLEAVTVNAPDHETLKLVWTARSLYKPSRQKLTPAQTVELTRTMLLAYQMAQEKPEMKPEIDRVKRRVQVYQDLLRDYGLRDWQMVHTTSQHPLDLLHRLTTRIAMLLCYTIFLSIPGLMVLPLILLARFVAARKAKQAVANSAVKLKGMDVMATFKVLTWIIVAPVFTILYAVMAGYFFGANVGLITALVLPALGHQAIKAQDRWRDLGRSIKPLSLALYYHCRGDRGHIPPLIALRREVQKEVRQLANRFGPELGFKQPSGIDSSMRRCASDTRISERWKAD